MAVDLENREDESMSDIALEQPSLLIFEAIAAM